MFITSTSTSPSLSMSPNAAPRLECGVAAPGPLAAVTSSKRVPSAVPEHDARPAVRILLERPLDFRIHVAGHVEEIDEAIVVEIRQPGAPFDVADSARSGRRPSRCPRTALYRGCDTRTGMSSAKCVLTRSSSAIVVVVARGQAHARLGTPLVVIRGPAFNRDISERAVLVVAIENRRRGI